MLLWGFFLALAFSFSLDVLLSIFFSKYFLVLADMVITSLNERFEQLIFHSNFGFLCDSNKLKLLDGESLRAYCVSFWTTYSQNNVQDVDNIDDLFLELRLKSVAKGFTG